MIRPARSDSMTDQEFAEIMEPFENDICNKIKDIINNFIAYYIASQFNHDCLWADDKFEYECKDALSYFNDGPYRDYDPHRIKDILLNDYSMKIVSKDPLNIEKVQQD